MMPKYVRKDRDGHTVVATIDNPPVNALHPDVSDEILAIIHEIEDDPTVRSFILTGIGRCFVAGGDIKFFTTLNRHTAAKMALQVQAMQEALFRLRVPVIAALNGHALGGGLELMMACDIAIAEEQAKIGLTEVRLGLIPGAGGTRMLARLVAPGTAKRLLFTGEHMTAAYAAQIGLVDQVVPAGGALQAAKELAIRINAMGPLAVAAAKKSANFGADHSLDEGHRREVDLFADLFDSDDHREGINAFLERRPAKFRGN
jgi:enoyl-CoA hydratase